MAGTLLIALLFAASTTLIVRRTADGGSDGPARALVTLAWLIVLAAAVLSAAGQLGQVRAWAIAGLAMIATTWAAARPRARLRPAYASSALVARVTGHAAAWVTFALRALALTAAVVVVANLILICGASPGSWDGLTYHLPRMALAVQHGSFWTGPVNFWAQAAHPVYSTSLLIFGAVASARNEHAAALWQLAAALIACDSVRRIAIRCGASREEAACSALLFLLLPQSIVQSAAVGNDMMLAAITAAAADRVLQFSRDGRNAHLVWIALAVGLGLGMKLSFVCQAIVLGAIALMILPRDRMRHAVPRLTGAFAAAIILAAPSGYISNLQRWGTIVGPPDAVSAHTFAGESTIERSRNTARNTLRFATDFVSLDGMPRVGPVLHAQTALRRVVMSPFEWAGIDLAAGGGARSGFLPDRPAFAHEAHSYWGIAGLLLIWPAVLAAVFTRSSVEGRALAWGTIAFLLVQAASGPYDSFRGRYFLSAAVLACPLCARWFRVRGLAARVFVLGALALTVITALSSAIFRTGAPLVAVRHGGTDYRSILSQDRAAQLTRNNPRYAEAVRRFERDVPQHAAIALWLPPDSFEYPLFGLHVDRRIVPVGDHSLADPAAATDYLVFSSALMDPRATDTHLGEDWWLRAR